mgnify:FL=1|tara:strand:+ start:153 stop:602 length:450 start_codon:yes stop_codon:yes gene_type:complete
MRIILSFIIYFILIYPIQNTLAEEFVMLKNNKVNVRYGPSFEYPIKYVYLKKNLPIKVIDRKENFRRIIDHKSNSGWIHTSQLKKSSSVILTKNQFVFSKPTKFSQPIAIAEKGKLLLLKKCKKNWCKINATNFSGWVQFDNFWGRLLN